MKKLIPHPGLSGLLLIIWVFVNNTFAPGHIVLGGVLAILIPYATAAFLPGKIHFPHPLLLLRYLGTLLLDIVVANLQVALWIVQPNRKLQPAFIHYKLSLESPLAITVLANTISLTPGTVSCDVSPDQQHLLIHSLHTEDPKKVIEHIHTRYEKPLLEVRHDHTHQ